MTNITLNTIHKDLEFLKNKVIKIEEPIIESELSKDDKKAIDQALKEEKQGKLLTKNQIFD
jgi:hypothetical protein